MSASGHPPRDAGRSASEWSAEEAELLRTLFLDEAQNHLRLITEAQHLLSRASDNAAPVAGDTIDSLLRHLHTLKGAAGSVGLEAIGRAAHELEDLCAEIRSGSLAPTPGILERIDEGVAGLGALLDGARAAPMRSGTVGASNATAGTAEERERRRMPDRRVGLERRGGDRSVRVDSARLDALLDGVGDLVILRTRVERRLLELEGVLRDLDRTRTSLRAISTTASSRPAPAGKHATPAAEPSPPFAATGALLDRLAEVEVDFTDAFRHLDRATRALAGEGEALRRTTAQLDQELRHARLTPLEQAFARLPLALGEIERTAGCEADLVVRGGEIEVDKSLVEQIADPLLHLLRNAMAHGVEGPDTREECGKPRRGRIQVTARQEGEFVFIVFEDDGRGINRAEVRRALVRMGRLGPEDPLRESVLLSVLFEPGFSIRAEADALAGRGMGLNIVKRSIMRLGGDVTVEYTPGAGTRFRLAVPLHAAITEAVLFKVGGQVYAVPAAHVVQAIPLGPDALLVKDGALEGVAIRESGSEGPIRILRLQSLFGVEMPPERRAAALHIRYGERSFIATCDKIIGPRTIVVRPCGPILGMLPLYAGVTISGAGKAQLVLDLGALADAAYAPVRPTPGTAARRSRPRILVVDDSRLARESTAQILIAAGFQPVTAEDGWEAWEMLSERRYDAVITDLEMPRVDGFELIERIRREATLKELPIIVVSSRTGRAMRDRARAAGGNVVLPKGLPKRALTDAVKALLAGKSSRRDD